MGTEENIVEELFINMWADLRETSKGWGAILGLQQGGSITAPRPEGERGEGYQNPERAIALEKLRDGLWP